MNQVIKHINKSLSTILQRNTISYPAESFRDISLSLILFSYISSINTKKQESIQNIINNPKEYLNQNPHDVDVNRIYIIQDNSVVSSFLKIISEDNHIHSVILDLWKGYFLDKAIFHSNVFSTVFNQVLESTSELTHHKVGSSYTPENVVNLLTQLLQPQEGEKVYDPVCGTGGLLVSLSSYTRKSKKIIPYGEEINKHISDIARMNLYINKLPYENISTTNCLSFHDRNFAPNFDIVVANPPFSLKNWETSHLLDTFFEYGIPPKSNGDFAFIQYALSSLNTKGRAGIIAPQGVLFRSGIKESNIRKGIIESCVLETIVQLPANIFVGTTIGACILLFNKRKTNRDILLVDASNEYINSKPKNILSENHIKKIIELVSNKSPKMKQAYLATYNEIVNNKYNLSFSRYFDIQNSKKSKSVNELYEKQITLEKKLTHLQNVFHRFR